MNKILNKLSLAGDNFVPKMQKELNQTKFQEIKHLKLQKILNTMVIKED